MASTRSTLIGMLFLNPSFTVKGIAEKCERTPAEIEDFFSGLARAGLLEHDVKTKTWRRTSKAGLTEGAMVKQAVESGVDMNAPLGR